MNGSRSLCGRALSRRDLLALGAGLGAARLSPAWAQTSAASPRPLITRPIPRTGERLPIVGLGTANVFDIGNDRQKRADCADVMRTLVGQGAKLVDTAPSYGTAEAVVGDLLTEAGLRGRVFLATKLERYDRRTGLSELGDSLRRLRTDTVDLMQLHNVHDANQDLGMLREWQAQGKCRYVGITTTFKSDFAAAEAILRREKPDFLQIDYALDDRDAEKRVIPAAAEIGAAVLTALPFGRGRLFRSVRGRSLPDWAQELDIATWAQFFLKYMLGNAAVTAVIPGTDKAEHMIDNLDAGRGRLPDAAQREMMVRLIESLG